MFRARKGSDQLKKAGYNFEVVKRFFNLFIRKNSRSSDFKGLTKKVMMKYYSRYLLGGVNDDFYVLSDPDPSNRRFFLFDIRTGKKIVKKGLKGVSIKELSNKELFHQMPMCAVFPSNKFLFLKIRDDTIKRKGQSLIRNLSKKRKSTKSIKSTLRFRFFDENLDQTNKGSFSFNVDQHHDDGSRRVLSTIAFSRLQNQSLVHFAFDGCGLYSININSGDRKLEEIDPPSKYYSNSNLYSNSTLELLDLPQKDFYLVVAKNLDSAKCGYFILNKLSGEFYSASAIDKDDYAYRVFKVNKDSFGLCCFNKIYIIKNIKERRVKELSSSRKKVSSSNVGKSTCKVEVLKIITAESLGFKNKDDVFHLYFPVCIDSKVVFLYLHGKSRLFPSIITYDLEKGKRIDSRDVIKILRKNEIFAKHFDFNEILRKSHKKKKKQKELDSADDSSGETPGEDESSEEEKKKKKKKKTKKKEDEEDDVFDVISSMSSDESEEDEGESEDDDLLIEKNDEDDFVETKHYESSQGVFFNFNYSEKLRKKSEELQKEMEQKLKFYSKELRKCERKKRYNENEDEEEGESEDYLDDNNCENYGNKSRRIKRDYSKKEREKEREKEEHYFSEDYDDQYEGETGESSLSEDSSYDDQFDSDSKKDHGDSSFSEDEDDQDYSSSGEEHQRQQIDVDQKSCSKNKKKKKKKKKVFKQ